MYLCICEITLNDVKEIINIFFWCFTAILAYKTYKNAKKTLFNPIRGEMVKYQMKVITEFIDNHTSTGLDFNITVDYPKLIIINYQAEYLLEIFKDEHRFENHEFNEDDKVAIDNCKENLAGLFEVLKIGDIYNFEPCTITNFENAKQYVSSQKVQKKENENIDLVIQRFYVTKKFQRIYTELLNLRSNPFIPEEIKIQVNIIIENIFKNLHLLYEIRLEYVINDKKGTYQDIYSEFLLRKTDHAEDIKSLHKKITKYFKVNKV